MSIVSVDFSRQTGEIKPMHGVNSGPKTYCFWMDTTKYFIEAGIPYSRLHDTEYPFGSGHFIDIPCVFKNFDADENDPASYDFGLSDEYIKAIQAAGTETFYRLGVTIEHSPVKKNNSPPKDPAKWARVCEHIVRHYNEGWAEGFTFGLKYWEIWNEPEGNGTWSRVMWTGTDEQYFDLYITTAKHLKKCFPDIKVGGYASRSHGPLYDRDNGIEDFKIKFAEDFFRAVSAAKAPLDFYSWHLYSGTVSAYVAHAKYARELTDRYGYPDAEIICDEWNYAGTNMFVSMTTEVGASLDAAFMIAMQECGVSLAAYYDAQPAMTYCGIFDHGDRTPTKAFYAFKAWNELYKLKNGVYCTAYEDGKYACAAVNGGEAAILLSSYESASGEVTFDVHGFAGENGVEVETWVVDRNSKLYDLRNTEILMGVSYKTVRKVDAHTMLLLKLKRL